MKEESEKQYIDKCGIFIDGGYLNSELKTLGNFKLDFLKLSEKISKSIGAKRLRTYYYDCLPIKLPGNSKSEVFYESKKRFCHKISILPRFEVKYGELQFIKGFYRQKKIDVLMSLDIADKCFEKQIQHAIIIAGDSDFIPAIKKAKDYGAIVHLFAHQDSINKEMLEEIDEFHNLNIDFLKDCMLEETSKNN